MNPPYTLLSTTIQQAVKPNHYNEVNERASKLASKSNKRANEQRQQQQQQQNENKNTSCY